LNRSWPLAGLPLPLVEQRATLKTQSATRSSENEGREDSFGRFRKMALVSKPAHPGTEPSLTRIASICWRISDFQKLIPQFLRHPS
jgi:hypothetical protein